MKFYLDTSVFGGYFDQEFEEDTKALFKGLKGSGHYVVCSAVNEYELMGAPQPVREFFEEVVHGNHGIKIQFTGLIADMEQLAQLYIKRGVLPKKCMDDARHIAAATLTASTVLVSWNFKHIVDFRRIRMYNAVNSEEGFPSIDIRCPKEISL